VIGAPDVGMGHIYRCLTIAHEITDHEVIFFTDVANEVAVRQLTKYEYDTHISSKDDIVRKIIDMKPDLVINDILNTRIDDIQPLRDRKIPVINFEDLGDGARSADITINELYETAQLEGSNLLWGSEYFFLRDEFANATPNSFATEVKGLLITFGGTDQHDLSRKILRAIRDTCRSLNVKIFLVTGPGYERFEELEKEVDGDDEIHVTHATGVISEIMEYVQIAVTSNGRTVYELAHMNVPAVVISQHDREQTHLFAQQDRGFIPVGGYDPGKTEIRVHQEVSELLTTQSKRRSLFNGMKQINFEGNKQRVIKIIEELL
jgi:spore coat polysaccharide biosynthesis predicted glycosyltransferase SpsG